MAKYTQEKSKIISLFFKDTLLTNLFLLPIQLSSFTQYSWVTVQNDSSRIPYLKLNKEIVAKWQNDHELVLKDFFEFKKQLTRLRGFLNDLSNYSNEAKNSDLKSTFERRICNVIDKMVEVKLLQASGPRGPYVFLSPNVKSPYVQFEALLKFKNVDRYLLENGQATLNHFISLTDFEAKKLQANLKKLDRVEQMMSADSRAGLSAFHLNLGIHPLHWEKFTHEHLQYYYQQLKIWFRQTIPHIDFISVARNDIQKGYNIHIFFYYLRYWYT